MEGGQCLEALTNLANQLPSVIPTVPAPVKRPAKKGKLKLK